MDGMPLVAVSSLINCYEGSSILPPSTITHGFVAQLVEQGPLTAKVARADRAEVTKQN